MMRYFVIILLEILLLNKLMPVKQF